MRLAGSATSPGSPTDEHVWLEPFLDALLTPAAVLSPVTVEGEIVDFAFTRVNALAREYGHERRVELLGGRLREMNPQTSVWLLPALREVLATGVARQFDDVYLGPRGAPHRAAHHRAGGPGVGPVGLLLAGQHRRRGAARTGAPCGADRAHGILLVGPAHR